MIYEKYLNEFRKNLSVDDLSQIQMALDTALEDKKNQEIELLREEIKRKTDALGIDPATIFGSASTKRIRKPIAPKYRIVSDDGTVHEWSGRGLRPKVFQGYSKEEIEARFRI